MWKTKFQISILSRIPIFVGFLCLYIVKSLGGTTTRLVSFDYQNVNSLSLFHHYINRLCKFCAPIELQKINCPQSVLIVSLVYYVIINLWYCRRYQYSPQKFIGNSEYYKTGLENKNKQNKGAQI